MTNISSAPALCLMHAGWDSSNNCGKMLSVAAILLRPTFISTRLVKPPGAPPRISRTRRLQQFYLYPIPGKLLRPSSTMAEPSRIRTGNEAGKGGGVRAFQLGTFVDVSSSPAVNGLEATLNNLSKWLVVVLFGIFLLTRHDAAAMWAALGSAINFALSTILKRLLNQERPVSNLRSDPGMPSSHAQSISYITAFAILSVVQWWGLNGFTATISGIFLALGSYFIWLRVSQQLHTISQIAVCALLGTIFSTLWFWSWDSIVLKAYVSNLWVQIVVILGAAAFCIGFILHVIRYWFMESESFVPRYLGSTVCHNHFSIIGTNKLRKTKKGAKQSIKHHWLVRTLA